MMSYQKQILSELPLYQTMGVTPISGFLLTILIMETVKALARIIQKMVIL